MDNFEHALEKENRRLAAEVERFTKERDTAIYMHNEESLAHCHVRAEVERLTRERDKAERLGRIVTDERDTARAQRDEERAAFNRAAAEMLALQSRAEAAEADNAALLDKLRWCNSKLDDTLGYTKCSVIREGCGEASCTPCLVRQSFDLIHSDHPGAALLERLRKQNEDICRMAEEIEAWKNATGLERGGDPDGVRPNDIAREMERLRAAEKVVEAARVSRRDGLHGQLDAALAAYDAAKEGA